jgi:hypothetical protein
VKRLTLRLHLSESSDGGRVRCPVPKTPQKDLQMKLIIEKTNNCYYAYTEDQHHHDTVEPGRSAESVRMKQSWLEESCDLADMPEGSYIVFDIKES